MPNSPAVSVIMTAYNAEHWLSEAIESVLNQTLSNFEMIFVDDGSTDSTFKIAMHYAKQDDRMKVMRLAYNKGSAYAKNMALKHARAPLIAICDADDKQFPDRLERQVSAFEDEDLVLAGCRVRSFGGEADGADVWMPFETGIARAHILFQVLCGDAANMFRRSLISQHGLHYPLDNTWEDWIFQAQALRYGKIAVLPDILLNYRRHPNQQTSADQFKNGQRRTLLTMQKIFNMVGIMASEEELALHHAISPHPFGCLTDPDYLERNRHNIHELARAWIDHLGNEVERTGWTTRDAIERQADQILRNLDSLAKINIGKYCL